MTCVRVGVHKKYCVRYVFQLLSEKKKFDKTHSPSASPHVEFRKAALCEPGELTQPLGLIYILSISSQEHHEQGINSSYLILPDRTMHMLPATSHAFEIMQRLDFEEALPGCFDVAACDLQMGTRRKPTGDYQQFCQLLKNIQSSQPIAKEHQSGYAVMSVYAPASGFPVANCWTGVKIEIGLIKLKTRKSVLQVRIEFGLASFNQRGLRVASFVSEQGVWFKAIGSNC